jgi:uncharacterized membrane protein HdeD (DUF308 family)
VPKLDDFLDPLHHGVWEVEVPKEAVNEPLDEEWAKSSINLPTPGTIASYRKGQYHVHETATEWKVHLDRYDPKVHPIMHLIDDAPLVFLISGTFRTLLTETRSSRSRETSAVVEEQKAAWKVMIVAGFCLILVGVVVGLHPLVAFQEVILTLVRLIVLGLGILVLGSGLKLWSLEIVSRGRIAMGVGLLAIGLMPLNLLAGGLVVVLAVWAFASAFVSLRRTARGRMAVPEGFYKRLGMGIFSLGLALLFLVSPAASIVILVIIIGALAVLVGITLIVHGFALWQRMKVSR